MCQWIVTYQILNPLLKSSKRFSLQFQTFSTCCNMYTILSWYSTCNINSPSLLLSLGSESHVNAYLASCYIIPSKLKKTHRIETGWLLSQDEVKGRQKELPGDLIRVVQKRKIEKNEVGPSVLWTIRLGEDVVIYRFYFCRTFSSLYKSI